MMSGAIQVWHVFTGIGALLGFVSTGFLVYDRLLRYRPILSIAAVRGLDGISQHADPMLRVKNVAPFDLLVDRFEVKPPHCGIASGSTLTILAATLAAGPCGDLAFICNKYGQPFTKESFGNAFKDACRAAGISGKSAHGLRKLGATRAANAGATESQLKAIFGWTNSRMPALYTQAADRRRLAKEAMHKLSAGS
jgi:hypothetical protein